MIFDKMMQNKSYKFNNAETKKFWGELNVKFLNLTVIWQTHANIGPVLD